MLKPQSKTYHLPSWKWPSVYTLMLPIKKSLESSYSKCLLARTTGTESRDVRNSAWRSLLVLGTLCIWSLKSTQTTRWHIDTGWNISWVSFRWPGRLDERLCPCHGEDGGKWLRQPCGCSGLHHWGKNCSDPSPKTYLGCVPIPIWTSLEHGLVLLQTWSCWFWACICYQIWLLGLLLVFWGSHRQCCPGWRCRVSPPITPFALTEVTLDREEMWSFTGSANQLWKWSESGNQLINVATGKPLAVGGFTEWRVASRVLL